MPVVSGYDAGMSDLIAFCNARISEKEARAREVQQHFDDGRFDDLDGPGSRVEEAAQARREAWAMRQIAAHMTAPRMTASLDGLIVNGRFRTTGDHALRLLAAIWSDHPDYEEAMKP